MQETDRYDKKDKKVLIFGVFDGLHAGHSFFIDEAAKYGTNLVIVVTEDEVVNKMKDHFPKNNLFDRMQALKKAYPKAKVRVGDMRMGAWTPIYEEKPDIVVCGYDQDKLFRSLRDPSKKYIFKRVQLDKSFKKTKLHSSILNK
jgi:FAD synthetase